MDISKRHFFDFKIFLINRVLTISRIFCLKSVTLTLKSLARVVRVVLQEETMLELMESFLDWVGKYIDGKLSGGKIY